MYHLFVRLNGAESGGRFVQTSSSSDLVRWSAFRPLVFDGLKAATGMATSPAPDRAGVTGTGGDRRSMPRELDVYFLLASSNPVLPTTLVALLPVAHRGVGCVGVALSEDGQHWSAIAPIASCATDAADRNLSSSLPSSSSTSSLPSSSTSSSAGTVPIPEPVLRHHKGERSTSQPAAGVLRIGGSVVFWVHENVPGIYNLAEGAQTRRPALRRYAVPARRFLEWTTATLAGCKCCREKSR